MKQRIKLKSLLFLCCLLASAGAQSQRSNPTAGMEPMLDLKFTATERDSLLSRLEDYLTLYKSLHHHALPNSAGMALFFDPRPTGFVMPADVEKPEWNLPDHVAMPANREALAFMPVYQLASLIRSRQLTSVELTKLYIARLKRHSETLQCTITLMEESALSQASRADREIATGRYRGPLHGIPYGLKDLFAVEGTPTTWGATPYREQVVAGTATVVRKLEEAGAVLVAKLTLGALAMGDIWYGGKTRNPWNLLQGSSGSSAGSAAATAAGLVAFAIGTETWGSIVSPSTRCGATGLRPTFGAVSRAGAMTLSWSMDKVGPICRSALDCALVYDVIRGEDAADPVTRKSTFSYRAATPITRLRIGYIKSLFDLDTANRGHHDRALNVLRKLGVDLVPVEVPQGLPVDALSMITGVEGAAAFDELTRSDRDSLLTDQRKGAWPNIFRAAHFVPAVEYINAQRVRRQLIEDWHQRLGEFDVIVAPTFGGNQNLMTNLTGHPCLVLPDGFTEKGTPTSISFIGKLYGEAALISVGRAFQEATTWHQQVPPLFRE